MQIGLWIDDTLPFPDVVGTVRDAAALGYTRAWFGERDGWDALTLLTAVGSRVPGIGLGTAIVSTWPRHPLALAAQALTAQAATDGRLVLGVGPSHRPLVQHRFGIPWERPGQHVEEYLDVLAPVLHGTAVDGPRARGGVTVTDVAPPPLLLSAHGPRLLRLAGERADGVITTWTTPRGLAEHVVPAVTAAAAGRPAPRVVVGLVASLTDDPDAARAHVASVMGAAEGLPSYRRSLDRDGLAGVADTVVAGDERELADAVRRFADAGATEIQLCPVGPVAERARTVELVGSLAG